MFPREHHRSKPVLKPRLFATKRLTTEGLSSATSGRSRIYLEVRDPGNGMDRGTQERMFDPFFSTKFLGRGLGLAAVLGIVRAHQGALFVESVPDHGSQFTIMLPVARGGEQLVGSDTGTPALLTT